MNQPIRNPRQEAVSRIAQSLGYAFTSFLDPQRLNEVGDDLRLISKVCKHDLGLVTVSLVLSCLVRSGEAQGRFADARLLYQQMGGPVTPEASFRLQARNAGDLLFFLFKQRLKLLATRVAPALQGRLSHFVDLLIADGSVYKVATALSDFLPGTKTEAAFKLHAVYSVKQSAPLSLEFTSGRAHESTHFAPDVWVKGALYLWDLGFDDNSRTIDACEGGAYILQRIKINANPVTLCYYDESGEKHILKGTKGGKRRLNEVCEFETKLHEMKEIDFDVELEDENHRKKTLRVVCVPINGVDHFYLTSLPREYFTPFDIAEIYTVRWEIELFFKHLKGGTRLDEVNRMKNLHSVRSITYASLLAALLTQEIVIEANLKQTAPPDSEIQKEKKEEPPTAAFSP